MQCALCLSFPLLASQCLPFPLRTSSSFTCLNLLHFSPASARTLNAKLSANDLFDLSTDSNFSWQQVCTPKCISECTHTRSLARTHTHTHLGRVNERMRVVAAAEAMANLAPLLERTVTLEGTVHELSSLVADPGAPRQCIHADTSVHPQP